MLHLGYVRERAQARNKKQRDTELLWRSVGEDPNDFYSWFKLLELARFWNDPQLADSGRPRAAWRPWTGPGRGAGRAGRSGASWWC